MFLKKKLPKLHAILKTTTENDMIAEESITKPDQYFHDNIIFQYLLISAENVRKYCDKKIVILHPSFISR